jgi:hypothetical protein
MAESRMEGKALRDLVFPKSRVANGRSPCMLCGDDLSTSGRDILSPSGALSHIGSQHALVLDADQDEAFCSLIVRRLTLFRLLPC